MEKNILEERINFISSEMMRLKENYSRLEGALSEATFWLKKINKSQEGLSNGETHDQSTQQAA